MFGICERARVRCRGVRDHSDRGDPRRRARRQRAFDVGIAGAGQLARMTCLAAWPLGIRVGRARLARRARGARWPPAWSRATGATPEAVRALGARVGVVTLENEFVDAAALASVQAAGTPVRPDPSSLGQVQDKALQKELLRGAGLPTAAFLVVEKPARARRRRARPRLAPDAEGAAARLRRLRQRDLRRRGRGPRRDGAPRRRRGRAGGGDGRLREGAGGDGRPRTERRRGLLPGGRDRAARPRLPRGRGARPDRARRPGARPRGVAGGGARRPRRRRDRRRDVPVPDRRGPGERARPPPPQLRALHDRGLRDLAVREPPARGPRHAPRRRPHALPRRGDGEPARKRGRARRGPTRPPRSRWRAPTCTSTTRPRCGRAARWAM